jgi:branched-chain amino acid transport system permease protein
MWRMVLMPLVLVILMIYRPRGIMGLREFRWFIPGYDLIASKRWKQKKEANHVDAS